MLTPTDIVVHILLFIALYFEVFLLIAFLGRREKDLPAQLSHYPSATIIVPCYNEERTVTRTVESLAALEYPADKLKIMVVDDGSTDKTWQVLQTLSAQFPQIEIYHKENGGKHTALNFGITHSDSELIGCLDADSTVAPDALKEIVRMFLAEEAMAVIPAIKVTPPKTLLQHIQKAEYALSIFVRKVFSFIDANFVTPGPFSFFRREVFEKIGLYKHAHNTEDMEMAMRMQYHHMKIANANRAYVYTNTPPTLMKLVRQRVRWTYGFLRNFMDYRRKLVFRPSYGNIGMFVLPTAMFSIFSGIFLTSVAVVSAAELLSTKLVKYRTIGFDSPSFTFDWFFINTQSIILLTLTILAVTSILIMIGKSLSGEPRRPSMDIVAYLLFYGLIAPLWLVKSLYNALRNRETSWTAERN